MLSVVLTDVASPDKTEDDADREAQLLEMRLTLTEERNAVMVPSAGSGIPGAPAEWYEHALPHERINIKMMHGFFPT